MSGLPRAVDVALAGAGARDRRRRSLAVAPRSRSSSTRAGRCSTASGASAATGAQFELLKLRTMGAGRRPGRGRDRGRSTGDPRVTRVGGVLRRLSLDELPNLINVLRGEMAIVGPRPTIEAQVELYTPHQRRRLEVKPGITGWAQVNGRAGIPWEERIELDVWYVEHRVPRLDLRILARTARLLLSGTGSTGRSAAAG